MNSIPLESRGQIYRVPVLQGGAFRYTPRNIGDFPFDMKYRALNRPTQLSRVSYLPLQGDAALGEQEADLQNVLEQFMQGLTVELLMLAYQIPEVG